MPRNRLPSSCRLALAGNLLRRLASGPRPTRPGTGAHENPMDPPDRRETRPGRERRLTVLVCALVLAATAPARAQSSADDLARTHFDSGAAYLEQADYDSALREFRAA